MAGVGEDTLVPRESPLENGRSRRHPIHFLTESPEDEVVRKKRGIERHPNTQASLEARKGFLFFLPGALSTAIAFSRKAGYGPK